MGMLLPGCLQCSLLSKQMLPWLLLKCFVYVCVFHVFVYLVPILFSASIFRKSIYHLIQIFPYPQQRHFNDVLNNFLKRKTSVTAVLC